MGFPARTEEYLTTTAIAYQVEESLPMKIKCRETRLQIMQNAMKQDSGIRLQYIAKYASASNAYKKWQGAVKGLQTADIITVRQNLENRIDSLIRSDSLKSRYTELLNDFGKVYAEKKSYSKAFDLFNETINTLEPDILILNNFVNISGLSDPDHNKKNKARKNSCWQVRTILKIIMRRLTSNYLSRP